MKVGNHDIAALRHGCIAAFSDTAMLHGMREEDTIRCLSLLLKGMASVAPLVSDEACAVTVALPVAFMCESPIACGGSSLDGVYSSHVFEVTGGIYHAGESHRYAFACSRNRRSFIVDHKSTTPFGAVYLHSNGVRKRKFRFDEYGNLTAYPGRQPK